MVDNDGQLLLIGLCSAHELDQTAETGTEDDDDEKPTRANKAVPPTPTEQFDAKKQKPETRKPDKKRRADDDDGVASAGRHLASSCRSHRSRHVLRGLPSRLAAIWQLCVTLLG